MSQTETVAEEFKEQTTPLLSPHQVREFSGEQKRLTAILNAPPHIGNVIQDRGELTRQLRMLNTQLEAETPREYGDMKDKAVKRERELRAEIQEGMPTQEEMRRRPAGAVDKHRSWEKRNKLKILEWKNIRKRLHAGGEISDLADATDISNFEQFRPSGGPNQLMMHGELIPGKQFHYPEGGPTPGPVFNDAAIDALKAACPEIVDKLGLLTSEQREKVKEFADGLMDEPKIEKGVPIPE